MGRKFWILDAVLKDCPDGKSRLCRVEDPALEQVEDPRMVEAVELEDNERIISVDDLNLMIEGRLSDMRSHDSDMALKERLIRLRDRK